MRAALLALTGLYVMFKLLPQTVTCRHRFPVCTIKQMAGDWKSHEQRVDEAREKLKHDPANLDLANAYWVALADWQSGRYLIDAYRTAALKSNAGVTAFARAYQELFKTTGECPRLAYFDPALIETLNNSLSHLPEQERSTVQWVLESISDSL